MWLALVGCVQTIQLDDPEPVGTIVETCESTTPSTETLTVAFPAREPGCAWGTGGNFEMEQGVVTARQEDSVALELPADIAICDVTFDFTGVDTGEQTMRYDDGFLLTFGDVVLAASSAGAVERFATEGMLRLYDWDALAGFAFGFEEETYCLGGAEGLSTCTVPPPETPGPIALAFGEPVVSALAERAYAAGSYEFGFVTFGDNDPDVDCSHAAFTFTVDVAHVPY